MKVRVFEDCVSYEKSTPFEVMLNGRVFSGVFIESGTSVGGLEAIPEHEIEWEDEAPEVDKREIIDLILNEIYKMNSV